MERLFGRRNGVATHDLPNNLGSLVDRLPAGSGNCVEDLARRHTLLPYHTAFQPLDVEQRSLAAMTGMAGSIHMMLGIAASSIRRPGALQFCPECLDAMTEEWGSPHWRRDQQLPGVLVCPEHRVRLRISGVVLARTNRHEFVPCTTDACAKDGRVVTGAMSAEIAETATEVALRSAALLDAQSAHLSFDERRDGYRARLARAGLMRGRFKADQNALLRRFTERFGPYLERVQGLSLDASTENWLSSLVRTSSGAQPPLQHILLEMFLDDQPEVPARRLRAYKPRLREQAVEASRRPVLVVPRRDWREVDLSYSIDLRREAAVIRSMAPPARVTLGAIEARLGRRDWLQKRRDKLPRSAAIAAQLTEDVRTYRLRRLDWHVDRCVRGGETDPWVVLRLAGLPGTHIRVVRDRLEARLSRFAGPSARIA